MLTLIPNLKANTSASSPLDPSLLILGAGAKWAAHNGNNTLYVDWYDNLIAHPNKWLPDPEVCLPERVLLSRVFEQNDLDVNFAGDIPSNLSSYSLVVLDAYWAVEPRHCQLIRDYIANGGGVVFLAGVPEYFRAYSKTWGCYGLPSDIASLGMEEWLGATDYENTGLHAYVSLVVDNPFGTSLLKGDNIFVGSSNSHASMASLNGDSQVVATWSSGFYFAYNHTYGQGRVYYQADFRNPMYPNPLTADFSVVPSPVINVGEPATFDASISRPAWNETYSAPIVEYLWDFGDGNASSSSDSTTTHVYLSSGLFKVTLTVFDSEGSDASCSQTVWVQVSSVLSISTSTPSTFIGFSVGINGTLTDRTGNGLENETVLLYYTFQGAYSWFPITSAITDRLGRFYVQWIPSATGAFTVIAQWNGNATIVGSMSTVALNTMPYENQYVFTVESNSTISALVFNSTSSALTFAVGGQSGTKGYAKVTIAKNLVGNVTDIEVYLDGNELPYSVTSIGDSWLLTFSYAHSIHNVSVSLNTKAIPELDLVTMLLLFTTIPMIIAILSKRRPEGTGLT
jgi:PKD repeat protein